jgi:hypothetical protein
LISVRHAHLALQDATGDTGKAFDAVRWNLLHGFGGPDHWHAQLD